MPSKVKHKTARCLVCAVCSCKLPRKDDNTPDVPRKNAGRLIDDNLEALLKIFVDKKFSLSSELFPKSVCLKCYVQLQKQSTPR